MEFHVYIHSTSETVERLKRLEEQGVKIMAAIDEVKAKIAKILSSVTEIHGDIQEVIAKLPTEGGMTAAEVAEVHTALDEVVARTGEVAGIVPETPPNV